MADQQRVRRRIERNKPKTSNANDSLFVLSPDINKRSKKIQKKANYSQRQKMKKRPETIFYDFKYECDDSNVMTLSDDPSNAKFLTARSDIWLSACPQYYNSLHDQGTLKKRPEIRHYMYGKQVLVPDNRSPDSSCYVTVFVYKTGVVLIQGHDCAKWETSDMPAIKSIVKDMESESHQSTTTDPIVDEQLLHEPSSPMSSCSSLNFVTKTPLQNCHLFSV